MTIGQTTRSPTDAQLAAELDEKIRKLGRLFRITTLELGWYSRLMKEKNLFAVLGYTEDAYRKDLGIAPATWYQAIQIAEGFKRLDKAVYLTMSIGKAYELLDLPEDERIKDVWVRRAAHPGISVANLAAEIKTRLESGEIRKDATSKEAREWLKIRMYTEAKARAEEILDNFCHEHGLGDDRGRALELLLADTTESGAAIIGVLADRLPELKATVELLKEASRPAEERCAAFEKFATQFLIDLGKASAAATRHFA